MMLATAYNVPKVAKYKSILMALLTMVQVTMLSGIHSSGAVVVLSGTFFVEVPLNERTSLLPQNNIPMPSGMQG
jgi:arginine metabolism regulation protein II